MPSLLPRAAASMAIAAMLLLAGVAPPPPRPAEPSPSPRADAAPSRRPNFVFILAEATGWSSTSVDMDGEEPSQSRPAALTPSLVRLAEEGMRFRDFYVTAPRCTPSRASFLTGISPSKLRMTYQGEGGAGRREEGDGSRYSMMRMIPPEAEQDLPSGVRTTGDAMREIGYATAHFGKWHAGRADPRENGFDVSDGPNSNQGPERGVPPNPRQATEIVDKALAFMREQVQAGKPFFVQVSHYGFGAEAEATPESVELARSLVAGASGKLLGAIAGQHDMDRGLARIRAALAELGVAGETYIFFSSDHGAQGGAGGRGSRGPNPPFSGGKGSVSEGGIRVPLIVAGPGIPAGVVSPVRATGMDLLPTMRDLAGSPLPPPEDPDAPTAVEGGSLAAVLRATGEGAGMGTVGRPREEIVIHFPHYDLSNGGPASAIYLDRYKLLRNDDAGTLRLYDVARDREEARDLSSEMPGKVKELEERLDAYLAAIRAPRARPNPDFGRSSAGGGASRPDASGDDPRRGARGQGQGQGRGEGRGGGREGDRRRSTEPGEDPNGGDA